MNFNDLEIEERSRFDVSKLNKKERKPNFDYSIHPVDKSMKSYMKKAYNLTVDEYRKLYFDQDKKCAICKVEKILGSQQGLHIDHCHKTGKVRGLLCARCNLIVGHIENSKDFDTYFKYILRHEKGTV